MCHFPLHENFNKFFSNFCHLLMSDLSQKKTREIHCAIFGQIFLTNYRMTDIHIKVHVRLTALHVGYLNEKSTDVPLGTYWTLDSWTIF